MKFYPPRLPIRAVRAAMAATALFCSLASIALAGGGPEGMVLVVNSADVGSKTIANYYVQLRKIPPANVVYLDPKTWNTSDSHIDINTFRDKILGAIIAELR